VEQPPVKVFKIVQARLLSNRLARHHDELVILPCHRLTYGLQFCSYFWLGKRTRGLDLDDQRGAIAKIDGKVRRVAANFVAIGIMKLNMMGLDQERPRNDT